MNRSMFLAIAAVVYAVFGLGLLFTPDLVATVFGTSLNPGGVQAARILGAALIGYTLICWWSREAAGGLQAVLRGNFVYNILGSLLALTRPRAASGASTAGSRSSSISGC